MPLNLFNKRIVLSGDVAYFRCVMTSEQDDRLWDLASESKSKLEYEIEQAVHDILGPEFVVRGVSVVRGSVTLLFAIGTTYYVISKYKNFVESLELLKSQLKRLMLRYFENMQPTIDITWTPGPSLANAEVIGPVYGSLDRIQLLLLSYLIISHAALLAMVLWLLYKKVSP
jgi:hypothetical protein